MLLVVEVICNHGNVGVGKGDTDRPNISGMKFKRIPPPFQRGEDILYVFS